MIESWFKGLLCPHPSFWCGQGTEHPNFFDNGRPFYLASKICSQCFYEFFDAAGHPTKYRKDLANRNKND